MHTQASTQQIPFGKLRRSPRNVRVRDDSYTASLAGLSASIKSEGLLQNLVVTEHGRGNKRIYEVEGGGRRFDALSLLKKEGVITDRTPIPVTIVSLDNATAASLAENNQREDLHPADEFVAFKTLIDEGRSIEHVAASFGVTPRVVERRLKLANVAPRFLTMFRADEIDLDDLMALAITEDHDKQGQVWDALPKHSRTAHYIREALTESEINPKHSAVAKFVTVAAYAKAGGAIRRDLFSDEDDGYLLDAALLQRLALDKLEAKAKAVQKEGFAWVETRLTMDYSDRQSFGSVGTVRREPTKKEATKITKLKEITEALEGRAQADELSDEELDEFDELEEELAKLEAELQVPDPAQAAVAGAIVTIGRDGKTEVLRGLIRPEDKRALKATKTAAASGKEAVGDEDGDSGQLSDRLARTLSAHVTQALQVQVARQPHVALALLTRTLAAQAVAFHSDSALQVRCTETPLARAAERIEESPAYIALQETRKALFASVPDVNSMDWYLQQTDETLLQLLAVCIAPAIDAVTGRDALAEEARTLARATSLDMADWWTPTADSYLRSVPKPLIAAAVAEAVSPQARAEVSKSKTKALMVSTAEAQLAGKRWVPSIMRF